MTQKISILALTALILLSFCLSFTLPSDAAYVECYCTFDGKPIISVGENMKKCIEQCGKVVGGQTECENDCKSCCEEKWCSRIGEGRSKESCISSCEKSCEFKKFMNDFISLFYILSGIVAMIMLVIHSLRIITSDDSKKREVSKKGIMYVIIALIIIGISGAVINALMKGIVQPSTLKTIESVEGCGGVILSADDEKFGSDNIKIEVRFMNNGDQLCKYWVKLYNKNMAIVKESLDIFLQPKETKTYEITTTVSILEDTYTVKLILDDFPSRRVVDTLGPIDIIDIY